MKFFWDRDTTTLLFCQRGVRYPGEILILLMASGISALLFDFFINIMHDNEKFYSKNLDS